MKEKYKKITFIWMLLLITILFQKNLFSDENQSLKRNIDNFVENEQQFQFSGLARFYNNINYYIVEKDKISKVENNRPYHLKKSQWLAVVGYKNVLLVKHNRILFHLKNDSLILSNSLLMASDITSLKIVQKQYLDDVSPELKKIKYNYLWAPFAFLSEIVEIVLMFIFNNIFNNWGLVLIFFVFFLKVLLFPISYMTLKLQNKVDRVKMKLTPMLKQIKTNYDGENAHNRTIAAYKALGVSPFFELKPMLGLIIQIPILIAILNVLGEMSQFQGNSFLWIKDLSYPDTIINLPFSIYLLGNGINLLPFIMVIISIYSGVIFQNKYISHQELKKKKRRLYLTAFAFFILFYPFPAIIVMYWTLSNILELIQKKYIKFDA